MDAELSQSSSSKMLSLDLAETKSILAETVCKICAIMAKMDIMKTKINSTDPVMSKIDATDVKESLSEIDVIRSVVNRLSIVYKLLIERREFSTTLSTVENRCHLSQSTLFLAGAFDDKVNVMKTKMNIESVLCQIFMPWI